MKQRPGRGVAWIDGTEIEHGGEHHRLHRTDCRHQQPLERRARFTASRVVERPGIERQCGVADAAEVFEDRRERRDIGSPDDSHSPRGSIDRHALDTAHGHQRALDQPGTAAAADTVDHQHHFATAVTQLADDVLLELWTAPGVAAARFTGRLRRRRAQPVVIRESQPLDPLGRCLTPVAAERA
jgi:hypothetical protein